MFAAGANLFDYVFGIGYIPALILSVVVVTAYTFLGGFGAVALTDFVQGTMMFFTVLYVPVAATFARGGPTSYMACTGKRRL